MNGVDFDRLSTTILQLFFLAPSVGVQISRQGLVSKPCRAEVYTGEVAMLSQIFTHCA